MTGWVVAALVAVVAGAGAWTLSGRIAGLRRRNEELLARAEGAEAGQRRTHLVESQLAQALDAMDLGVVVVDVEGVSTFRNRAAEAYVSARHGHALVEAALTELLSAASHGVIGEREVELIGPPLSAFRIRAFPLLTGDETQRAGAVALVEETTERRRVDQVRRDFVANISHELRTPIGAIGLLAETIREETDPEVVGRLARRMVSEAERVTATIEDLLELSHIEFGEGMSLEPVLLDHIVSEAVARLGHAAEQRHVALVVRVHGSPMVRADRRQLVSAVFNLIDNAVKFSGDGGVVTVEGSVQGGVAILSVTDRGVGIPSRDIDRVFERFYRVDRARSRETGGTGLGLAIVRHVVSNHGGEVRVSSQEGVGSTFSLSLPAEPSPGPAGDGDVAASSAAEEEVARW